MKKSKGLTRGLSRRQALIMAMASGMAVPAWQAVAAQAANGPYRLEDFFQNDGTKGAALSPSGDRLAVLDQRGEGEQTASFLTVRDAANPGVIKARFSIGNLSVMWVQWSGDNQLLVSVRRPPRDVLINARGQGKIKQTVQTYPMDRIVSIDATTGEMVVMFQNEPNRLRESPYLGFVTDFLPNDPDHILMPAVERDMTLGLYRMDVKTGRGERIERGNALTRGWVIHDGVPVMRRDINRRGNVETWYARMPGETNWRMMRRNRVRDAPEIEYVGQGKTPDTIRVVMRAEGDDLKTLRDIKLSDFSVSEAIAPKAGVEAIGGIYDSRGHWLGGAYYPERLDYVFDDPSLAAHYRALNQFFENDCDVTIRDITNDGNRMVAYVMGPREAGTWIFYDRTTRNILPLWSRNHLEYSRLGEGQRIEVQTRDNAMIEAYLTRPLSGQAGPLIVLPHGGPEVRDYRRFDRQVQMLASKGWWVLQPNFRGSGGYGQAFAQAGWKRWGTRMQEDVEDAIAQVIRDNGLDAGRVGIMGTSYGGYAAMMGAVRRPELYKAAISICGVTDLVEMLRWERNTDDTAEKIIFDFWTKRIGDLSTDGDAIAAASPRLRASEISCPVLLVHGKKDEVVPVAQSEIMLRALRSAGKPVEYIEIDGGHADWEDEDELMMMQSCIALFEKAFA